MRRLLPFITLIALPLLPMMESSAQTRTLARVAGWSAFGGTLADGRRTCGIDTINHELGKHFLLQYAEGDATLVARLHRNTWNIPPDRSVEVRIRIEEQVWNARAAPAQGQTASGQTAYTGLRWRVSGQVLNEFESAFRRAMRMEVSFPQGNERAWIFSLRGTNAIMNEFAACLGGIFDRSRGVPTQPHDGDATQPHRPSPPPPSPRPAEPTAPAPPSRKSGGVST